MYTNDVEQLSKEEESQSTDAEVTREDQDKINRFSSLHNRVKGWEGEIEVKKVSATSSMVFVLPFTCPYIGRRPSCEMSDLERATSFTSL